MIRPVPVLKFSDFKIEWSLLPMKEVAPLQRGFDLPTKLVEPGKFPVVYSNGILRKHKSFKSKAPGVVTGRSGTIGAITYVEDDYWPHNTSLWVTNFNSNNPKFIFYLYHTLNLKRYSTGSGVPTLNRNNIHSLKVYLPSLPEQKKIADFLSTVDKKIQALNKKKELLQSYKTGVMQKIFPTKGRQEPEIRFKQDDGSDYPEWVEKKLGEIGSFFSGGTPTSTNKNFYNGDIPFIKSGEIHSSVTEQFITHEALNKSSAKMVNKGDLLFALYGATSGEVAISQISGAINQALLCIRLDEDVQFLYYYLLHFKEWIIQTFLQGGQGNLSSSIIKNLIVSFPFLKEQTQIANFLSSIDNKINAVSLQIDKMKEWKKGLLQQMFV